MLRWPYLVPGFYSTHSSTRFQLPDEIQSRSVDKIVQRCSKNDGNRLLRQRPSASIHHTCFFVKNVTVQTAIYCKRSFVIFGPPESITAALIKRTNERRAATCRPHHFSSADIGEDSAGCCDRRSCYYSIRQPSKTHCARLGRTKIAT